MAPEELASLVAHVVRLPRLKLRGLMAVPELTTATALQRSQFHMLCELFDRLKKDGYELDTLSMGMSEDLDNAIAEGATMVRVGTAIFGPRRYLIPEEIAALAAKKRKDSDWLRVRHPLPRRGGPFPRRRPSLSERPGSKRLTRPYYRNPSPLVPPPNPPKFPPKPP